MPTGAITFVYCLLVILLISLVADGANAALPRPPHLHFGHHHRHPELRHVLADIHAAKIQRFSLFPRRSSGPRVAIGDLQRRLSRPFGVVDLPRGLPWIPGMPTVPEIPYSPINVDVPEDIPYIPFLEDRRRRRFNLFFGRNSVQAFGSRERNGGNLADRPRNIVQNPPLDSSVGPIDSYSAHKSEELRTQSKTRHVDSISEKISTIKVGVGEAPGSLPAEDAYLCNLDYTSINKTPVLKYCGGPNPSEKECCSALGSFIDGVAEANPNLFLSITIVPVANTHCRKVLKDILRSKGVEHNVFHLCPSTTILPLVSVSPKNTCPITTMHDFRERVKLSHLTEKCSKSKDPCATCGPAIHQTSVELAHSKSEAIIESCTAVVILRLAQSEPGPVASDLVHVQRTCRGSI